MIEGICHGTCRTDLALDSPEHLQWIRTDTMTGGITRKVPGGIMHKTHKLVTQITATAHMLERSVSTDMT